MAVHPITATNHSIISFKLPSLLLVACPRENNTAVSGAVASAGGSPSWPPVSLCSLSCNKIPCSGFAHACLFLARLVGRALGFRSSPDASRGGFCCLAADDRDTRVLAVGAVAASPDLNAAAGRFNLFRGSFSCN